MENKKLVVTLFEEVWDLIPKQKDFLKVRREEREKILIITLQENGKGSKIHRLNRTASEVLELCDGRHNIGQIILEMSNTYSQTNKITITEDVISSIRVMERKGLLSFVSPSSSV